MVDFTQLLQIRARKLDKQRQSERRMAEFCVLCRQEVEDARRAMDDYIEKIKTLEIDLLTDLVNTELKITDFKNIESKLKEAEEKANDLAGSHAKANDKLSYAEEKMTEERQASILLQSKLNKVTEINRIEKQAAQDKANTAEEAVMDEFVEVRYASKRSE